LALGNGHCLASSLNLRTMRGGRRRLDDVPDLSAGRTCTMIRDMRAILAITRHKSQNHSGHLRRLI
jgi:hypothetical protein